MFRFLNCVYLCILQICAVFQLITKRIVNAPCPEHDITLWSFGGLFFWYSTSYTMYPKVSISYSFSGQFQPFLSVIPVLYSLSTSETKCSSEPLIISKSPSMTAESVQAVFDHLKSQLQSCPLYAVIGYVNVDSTAFI